MTYNLDFKVLYDLQFGFQKHHSTEMALAQFLDKLTTTLDNGDISVGIFFDLSKAFDTFSHDILLKKLEFYGIRGTSLEWFASYLAGRQQCVHYKNATSKILEMKCGVPQGSILGPLLFI